jgi:glycosyltransferase involved in cell wall biosynthesis
MLSVIIPAFNEEKFLPRCLESLKNQKFKDFEIIVVDNNSTDKTAEIAKKFNVILVSEKSQGVAYARNKGAEIAKGEILIFNDMLFAKSLNKFIKIKNIIKSKNSF